MGKMQNKYLEIKNINKELVDWFEEIVDEHNCRVERKEWKSKYNSYVVYDYEPFCSEGFEINILFTPQCLYTKILIAAQNKIITLMYKKISAFLVILRSFKY